VQLKVQDALNAASRLKDDIEKNKPFMEVSGTFLALQKATDEAIAALPKVKLEADPTAINKSITDIGSAIGQLQSK
jgi:hypothetical protein